MPDWYLTKDGNRTLLYLYERHYSAYEYKDGRSAVYSLVLARKSFSEPETEAPDLLGASSSTIAGKRVSIARSSETKARSGHPSLSDKLTPLLISAGLVRGTTPYVSSGKGAEPQSRILFSSGRVAAMRNDQERAVDIGAPMTPEPRDLTERRVEAIARALNPGAWRDYPDYCVDTVEALRAQSTLLARQIIVADPATALLDRAAEVLVECREVLECVHDTYDMFGESQHKLPKDHVAIRTRALLQRLGDGNDALLTELRARAE